jgi:hypothetical protein
MLPVLKKSGMLGTDLATYQSNKRFKQNASLIRPEI